ncbi:MAG: GIY-YIG nuclease family protein [Ignavibacteriaceae bacterium]
MKMYFVYIIKSISLDMHYIGHTSDLNDRLLRHNRNTNKFTKNKGPWELIISYPCNSKSQAYQFELKLKGFKNSFKAIEFLKALVQSTPT